MALSFLFSAGDKDHEYCEVYDDEIYISSQGNTNEMVVGDTEYDLNNIYRSVGCEDLHINQEPNSTEDLDEKEVQDQDTDLAFDIGSQGHVGRLIAKFSS